MSSSYTGAVGGALSSAASDGSAPEKAPSTGATQAVIHVATDIIMNKRSTPVPKVSGTGRRLIRACGTALRASLRVTVRGSVAAKDLKWDVRTAGLKSTSVYYDDKSSFGWEYVSESDVTYFTFRIPHLNDVGQTNTLKSYYEVSLRGVFTSAYGEEVVDTVWLDLFSSEKEPEVIFLDSQICSLELALLSLLPGHGTPLTADKSCVLSKAAICAAAASRVSSGSGQQARSLCKEEFFLSQTSTIQPRLATLLDTVSSQLVLAWTAGVRTPVEKGVAQACGMANWPCITLRDPTADNGLEFAAATSLLQFTARHSSLVPGMRYKCFLTGNRVWTKPWVVDEGQTGVADVSEGDRLYLARQKDTGDILQLIQQRSSFKHGVVSLDISVLVGADGNFTADIDLSAMDIRRQKAKAQPEKAGLLALLCASGAGKEGAKGAPVSLVLILVPESSAHPVVGFCLPTIRVAEQPTSPPAHAATAGGKRSSSDASSNYSDDQDGPSPAPPAKKVKKTGAGTSAAAPVAAPSMQPPSPALSAASSSMRSTKGGRGKGARSPSTLAGGSSSSSSSSSTGSSDCFALGTSASSAPSASTHQPARSGKALQAKKPAAGKRTSSRASADAGGSLPSALVNLGEDHPGPYTVFPDGTTAPAHSPQHNGVIQQLLSEEDEQAVPQLWSDEELMAASTGLELDLASPLALEW